MERMSEVTQIIRSLAAGSLASGSLHQHARSTEDLLPLVYGELRRIANDQLGHERSDHTLQPTALVHEAYLRLLGGKESDCQQEPGQEQGWQNRGHFFAAAAEAMRRILIDHARHRSRLKRGGGARRVSLDAMNEPWIENADDLLALDESLQLFETIDAPKADLVKLKFFGGLSTHDAGKLLGLSPRTAERHWAYARVWLQRQMLEGED